MKYTAALLFLCAVASGLGAMQCIGDTGEPVDWWIAFKYPNPDGRDYSYTDANNSSFTLRRSTLQFATGSASGLNYTMSQIYGQTTNSISYVMFNDQPPEDRRRAVDEADEVEASQKAHAKGVIAMDNSGNGFWLLHSVPLFPVSPLEKPAFEYMDDSQTKYAQSFLCVSFSGWSTFNDIGYQLQVYRPQFYPSSMSTTMQSNAPNLYDAVEFGKYENTAMSSVKDLKSMKGLGIKSFAKTGYYGDGWDMYDELIAPTLKTNLNVETWRQGSGNPLPSNCTAQYKVMNVDYVDFSGEEWKYTKEHGKWAVSADSSATWVCVCGINRMGSQGKRGGGCMCMSRTSLHTSLLGSITSLGACG